jgi:hypothetical protein
MWTGLIYPSLQILGLKKIPLPSHDLQIVCRVPVRLEQKHPVGPNQVQPSSASFSAQQHDLDVRAFIVESIHYRLPFVALNFPV